MQKMVLASLMAMAVGGASAQVYVGGTVGQTTESTDCAGTTTCDRNDIGYKVYGGFKITPNWAVEAGYADFGKATPEGPTSFGQLRVDVKSTATFLVGVFRGDLTPQLAGVARLGVANVRTTAEATFLASNFEVSEKETKVKPLFGFALEYAFTPKIKATLDADFTKTADIDGESDKVRMLSIGAQYSF